VDRQPWREHGKCVALDPSDADELFYLGRGKSPKAAKAFCAGCAVRKQCLFYAVYYNMEGIWAGTTDDERKDLKPFIYEEVVLAMSETTFEIHDLKFYGVIDRRVPESESIHQSLESSGWDNERLVG
jgi:WhiB family transcriptional regulator, redox-sensing transcriptional regulator